jgi:hypothetical protein
MIATPQRQELENDFSNNVRIFTEKYWEHQNSGRIEFAPGEVQEALRDGLLWGLTVGARVLVTLW